MAVTTQSGPDPEVRKRIPVQERRIIQGAFLMSLLLHLVLAAATWRVPFYPEVDEAMARDRSREVEMILVDPPEEAGQEPDPTMPTAYTEIPDRQASETPPEKADYLAMHHSLAADNVVGGDGDTPAAAEQWISDQVRIRREDLEGAEGVQVTEKIPLVRRSEPGSEAAGQEQEARAAEEELRGDQGGRRGDWALPEPREGVQGQQEREAEKPGTEEPRLEEWWGDQDVSILKEGEQGQSGDRRFDFNQDARSKATSGVAIVDDFSLNTYEWAWAPWMNRFSNELHRHWVPPYAYRLGIVEGNTIIRLVVARTGRIESLEVMDTVGHQSLHEASEAALRAFAPYAPLPAGFPEENLVITLGLYYPALPRR